jgi:hypothetical protein
MSDNKASPPKVGRPTDYDPKFVEMMLEYFGRYLKTLDSEVDENGNKWKKADMQFPSLAGFAIKIGACRTTLHEWSVAKNEDDTLKYPEFSYVYNKAKDFQENYLLNGGLNGELNHSFAQFVMTNLLQYRNKPKDEIDTQINNTNTNNVDLGKLSEEELTKKIEEKLGKLK